MASSLQHRQIRYGAESVLQIVDLWEFPDGVGSRQDDFWLVYIHGGAWRDPRCLTDTAVPAIDRLLADDSSAAPVIPRKRIAGFASIGYRLSPHPEFPQDPSAVPTDEYRGARHPEHLRDVLAALAALAADKAHPVAQYISSGRYIAYGHSCGAFLTFQLWMDKATRNRQGEDDVRQVALPSCVVGLEGIYDLRGFVDRGVPFDYGPILRDIVVGAFGTDRADWDAASPGQYDWKTLDSDSKTRLAVVAYSPEDTLVDVGEVDTMEAALRRAESKSFHVLSRLDLKGDHDEVHEDGREVARVLGLALAEMDRLGIGKQ